MQQTNLTAGRQLQRTVPLASPASAPRTNRIEAPVADLIAALLEGLKIESVSYCHWKSNWRIDDWLAGDGDLDLLIAREDVSKFHSVLAQIGFRKALVSPSDELPGIANFYGYDSGLGSFIHVHAHYQLVLGHDASKNYRLPVERDVLESARDHGPIKIPSPEVELAIFIVRMMLKYSAIERFARFTLRRSNDSEVRRELSFLRLRIEEHTFRNVIERLLPTVRPGLIDECQRALLKGDSTLKLVGLRRRLESDLDSYSRLSPLHEGGRRVSAYASAFMRKIGLRGSKRKTLESGGSLIAFVGGDGSGKSSCVKDIGSLLGKKFKTLTAHLGKPPKSALTLLVIGAIRVRRYIGAFKSLLLTGSVEKTDSFQPKIDFLQRIRWLALARDRYRLFRKVRRYADNGGIAICDRFPTDNLNLMDGPRIKESLGGRSPTPIEARLIASEESFYQRIAPPDQLIVLRVDPDIAVRRKKDEPERHVRKRSREIWNANWKGTPAKVVDAGRPWNDVVRKVRQLVLEEL